MTRVVLAMSIVGSVLAAAPAAHAAVGFGRSVLAGANLSSPTSLQFGPDDRLYVATFDGTIKVFTVVRDGANDYRVTATETIAAVNNIVNHDDDGDPNGAVTGRLLTGLLVAGTASNPVIYATSSDPRIGAGTGGGDLNLDTNSGTLSRLTWTGSSWQHQVLVRGMPRSEENHGPNGMALSGNTLYIAYGGHTNKGGPSANFANLPEYALSAAILSVNLNHAALSTPPYDLPTLNDPDRPGSPDANDPFGGNDGLNQAKIVAGGPVQVFAPGFRNPYDFLIASSGKLYTIDNGPNGGWGDTPAGEGPGGNCTNASVGQNQGGQKDALHLVTTGYYGGHANPTRGNSSNTFGGQSPIIAENGVECDFRGSNTSESTSLIPPAGGPTMPASTNGLAEYTTSNFGGEMQGDIISASYTRETVVRIQLNASGTDIQALDPDFATFGDIPGSNKPLDVTVQGASGDFPGTIWVGDLNTDDIFVLEPNDFGGGGGECTGADDPGLDEDGDGYDNADEIDAGTNPCSAASTPPDADGDLTSDVNDSDDDNDGQPDTSDPFAIDPQNGITTSVPVVITWENDDPPPGGLANTGFTGLMSNGSNYASLFSPSGMVVGGAAGVLTVSSVPPGDAFKANDSQQYGLQLGVDPPGGTFTVSSRISAPFNGFEPINHQSMGIFIGDGTQNDYVKVAVKGATNTTDKINFLKEVGDAVQTQRNRNADMPGADYVDLFLTVDPAASTVQASYEVVRGGVSEGRANIGAPVSIPTGWISDPGRGMAVGILSTSRGPGSNFPATWDHFQVTMGT